MPDLDQRRWDNDWPDHYGDGRMFGGLAVGANIVNHLGLQVETGLSSYASLNLGPYTSSTLPDSTVDFINDFRLEASSRLIEELA